MSENISCSGDADNGNKCGCPDIENDNLCCSVKINNQICLLPPAKDGFRITFKIQPDVKIIQNAGEICVCGIYEKKIVYTGVEPGGCEIHRVKIRQDIPFQCCFKSCDFNEQDISDFEVAAIEVQSLCTTLSSRQTRAEMDVFFCIKETDVVRVRLSKSECCSPC